MNEKNPANQVIRPFAFLIKVASVTGTGKSGKVCGPYTIVCVFYYFFGRVHPTTFNRNRNSVLLWFVVANFRVWIRPKL